MADRVGEQFGSYRLVRLLGQGGFAEVYLGQHIYLDTPAAIKVLHHRLASDDIDSFLNEARTIARLIHPQIVRVLEFNVQDNVPYLVVDYAPNGTLRKKYTRGTQLPVATVVSYVRQIASALQYAHEQKIIHRDVKPENMLIGRQHEILLSDFGIALVAQSSHYESTQGIQELAGTIAYMAPEQIQSQAGPASDQYSLAVVTYEWLSGARPFQGSFAEVAVKHTMVAPPPLREKVPTLPAEVEAVVMKALAKDPKDRYASIQAFASALEQAYLQTVQTSSLPGNLPTIKLPMTGEAGDVSGQESVPLPVSAEQSSPVPPVASLSPATTTLLKLLRRHPVETTGLKKSLTTTPLPPGTETSPHLITRRRLLMGLAGIAAVGVVAGGLAVVTHLPGSPGISTSPNITQGQALYTYRGHTMRVWSTAWAPRTQRIVSASSDGTAQVWDAMTGDHRNVYRQHTDTVYTAAWSPDGTRIASGSYDQTVQIWDATFGDHYVTYNGHTSWVWSVAWSPGGNRIASAGGDATVHVWDAAGGGHTSIYRGHTAPVYAVAWSPDGTRIASAGGDGMVAIWNVADGKLLYAYEPGNAPIWSVGWSPNGIRIVSAGDDNTVQVWDAADGGHLYVYHGHSDFVYAAAWSPDGKRIASAGADKTVQVWNAIDGSNVFTYTGHSDAVRSLTWSHDGKYLASGSWDETVQVWQAK